MAALLFSVLGAVDARLDVGLPRRRDEQRHVARRHELRDVLAHLLAGDEQVLADVGQARVLGRVRVVGNHGDLRLERRVGRAVEGLGVDERDRDAVGAAGDGGVEGVDHLVDVRVLRARPLVAAAQQLAGVLGAVARRHEERVRRHVVDEDELELLRRLEDAVGRRTAAARLRLGRRGRPAVAATAAAAARRQDRRGGPAAPPVSAVRRVSAFSRECGVSSPLASSPSRRSIASWTGSMLGGCTDSSSDTSCSLLAASPSRGGNTEVQEGALRAERRKATLLRDGWTPPSRTTMHPRTGHVRLCSLQSAIVIAHIWPCQAKARHEPVDRRRRTPGRPALDRGKPHRFYATEGRPT